MVDVYSLIFFSASTSNTCFHAYVVTFRPPKLGAGSWPHTVLYCFSVLPESHSPAHAPGKRRRFAAALAALRSGWNLSAPSCFDVADVMCRWPTLKILPRLHASCTHAWLYLSRLSTRLNHSFPHAATTRISRLIYQRLNYCFYFIRYDSNKFDVSQELFGLSTSLVLSSI